jgi:hypothetical protein
MIQFRTQRMATSVVNRILAVHAGLPPAQEAGAPSAPAALPEGDALDARINAPKPATDASPQDAAGIALGGLAK